MSNVQMASITTHLLELKTFTIVVRICTVFMVGSILPNVLMKMCSLWKTGHFR